MSRVQILFQSYVTVEEDCLGLLLLSRFFWVSCSLVVRVSGLVRNEANYFVKCERCSPWITKADNCAARQREADNHDQQTAANIHEGRTTRSDKPEGDTTPKANNPKETDLDNAKANNPKETTAWATHFTRHICKNSFHPPEIHHSETKKMTDRIFQAPDPFRGNRSIPKRQRLNPSITPPWGLSM